MAGGGGGGDMMMKDKLGEMEFLPHYHDMHYSEEEGARGGGGGGSSTWWRKTNWARRNCYPRWPDMQSANLTYLPRSFGEPLVV